MQYIRDSCALQVDRVARLGNPTLDHLVVNTALGRLPPPTEPYSKALLPGVGALRGF